MADPSQHPRMTVDEFLAWDDGTDTRYELAGGEVRAMAAPASPHRTILINVGSEIRQRLRSRPPCRAEGEAAIRINEDTLWQADIAVTCGPNSHEVIEPMLIVEIQPPSTRRIDLGDKLDDYKQLASVQEIWMVDSTKRRIQVWERRESGWVGYDHIGRGDFASRMLGGDPFTLDAIYENSGLLSLTPPPRHTPPA